MNKPILKFSAVKPVYPEPRASIRVRPGAVLWPKPVTVAVLPVKKLINAKKKGAR